MPSFPSPPREVLIGDAAAFVGVTPRAIRHYHQVGLLPERERGGDGRRRYGYAEILRLLWIRRMADAGIALEDIRDAFDGAAPGSVGAGGVAPGGVAPGGVAPGGADGGGRGVGEDEVAGVLARLEAALAEQEAELQRKRAAVQRMRSLGSRLGLLDDLVSGRLESAPEGSLRQDDLDALLVTERVFGPLGAAVQAGRFVALAGDPELRAESDRVDAAEEALDDTVAVDDPRVERVAAERHAFETALMRACDEAGQAEEDDALFAAWDERHPPEDDGGASGPAPAAGPAASARARSAAEVVRSMPYDFSPARLRCMELAVRLGAEAAES